MGTEDKKKGGELKKNTFTFQCSVYFPLTLIHFLEPFSNSVIPSVKKFSLPVPWIFFFFYPSPQPFQLRQYKPLHCNIYFSHSSIMAYFFFYSPSSHFNFSRKDFFLIFTFVHNIFSNCILWELKGNKVL